MFAPLIPLNHRILVIDGNPSIHADFLPKPNTCDRLATIVRDCLDRGLHTPGSAA